MEEIKSPNKSDKSRNFKDPNEPKQSPFKAEQFEQKVTLLCRFCGGETCPQQNYLTNKKQPNAIEGLHSNWITDNILAMQRPSERLIARHNLYNVWKRERITTILNLQQPGQHPYCGDGIAGHHGFSYIPDKLYDHGIRFFNFSWEDMTATTCEYMMKIMDTFDITFQKGEKIAVHCHAGRGRTLMAICGWLIFSGQCTAKRSIELAIQKREGVLTKNSQRQFLYEFQNCKPQLIQFQKPSEKFLTLIERHQSALLQRKKSKTKNVPYFFYLLSDELQRRMYDEKKSLTPQIVVDSIKGTNWTDSDKDGLNQFKNWCNEVRVDHSAIQTYKTQVLFEGMFDYFDQMTFNLVDTHSCQHLQQIYKEGQTLINVLMNPQIINSVGSYVICTFLSFVMLLTQLKNFGLSEPQLDLVVNRVVKCLTSKKKYNKANFSGRFLISNPVFTKHQIFIKMLIMHGIQQNITAQKFQGIQRTIRKKNADIFFHKNSLKSNNQKQYFQQDVIKEEVYKKIR